MARPWIEVIPLPHTPFTCHTTLVSDVNTQWLWSSYKAFSLDFYLFWVWKRVPGYFVRKTFRSVFSFSLIFIFYFCKYEMTTPLIFSWACIMAISKIFLTSDLSYFYCKTHPPNAKFPQDSEYYVRIVINLLVNKLWSFYSLTNLRFMAIRFYSKVLFELKYH